MAMSSLQKVINKAWRAKKEGHSLAALQYYKEALEQLEDKASAYARKCPGTYSDEGNTRKINPLLFQVAREYLRRDDIATKISNNMATILAEEGDVEGAKKMFHQAIELTPEGQDYPDPKIGLSELEV